MSSNNVIRDEGTVDEQPASDASSASDAVPRRGVAVREAVDDAAGLLAEAGAVERGAELRPTVELERQGRIDYDWSREANVGHPSGTTLAAEERRLGEEQELARQRERALAAHEAGVDRAGSARVQSERASRERVREFRERGVLAGGGDLDVDPRERLDQEVLGEVHRCAVRLAERFQGPSRAAVAKALAERVACSGMDVTAAVLAVKEELAKGTDAVQPIGTIAEWMGDPRYSVQANVEGVVRTLYEPAASNQQQVGVIEDESGTAKLTIWKRSNLDTVLSEGDRVRVWNVEIGWYGGRPSLAATSRSTITILECGEGPSPVN